MTETDRYWLDVMNCSQGAGIPVRRAAMESWLKDTRMNAAKNIISQMDELGVDELSVIFTREQPTETP
jgi:hypothetical protein